MKYLGLSRLLAVLAVVAIFTACDKPKTSEPMADAGQTLVKFMADYNLINVNFVPTDQSIEMFDLRRDVASNTELNRDMTVIITEDMGIATAYDPALTPFPAGLIVTDPSVTKVGNNYTLKLKAGQFATQLKATVKNANTLNLSTRYATGFKITTVDADGKITAAPRTVVVEVGAKNQWDGVYQDDFCNYHPASNPGYTCSTTVVHMITTGANKVKIFWPLAGAYANPSVLGGALQYFGAQEPEYTINTATNVVTVQNTAAGAVTFYNMNSSFNSRYDAATKIFYTKFGYNNPGGVFDPAVTREWTQTIKYLGPR